MESGKTEITKKIDRKSIIPGFMIDVSIKRTAESHRNIISFKKLNVQDVFCSVRGSKK